MSAPDRPRTCGECRVYHPLRAFNERGDQDNCNPRGTRWHLTRRADQEACRSVHAVKVAVAVPEQEAML